MKYSSRRLAKQLIVTVCIGGIPLGISLAWSSPVLPQLKNSEVSFGINTNEASWIGSTLAIGTITSALLSGSLADRFGRKTCLLALVVPLSIFTLLVLLAQNVYYLYVARIFSGIATGGAAVIGPMYLGEIADVELRGILGSFFEFLIYVGVLLTATMGAYLNYKILTLILGIISVSLELGLIFFPETPTYHLMKNDKDKAEKALMFFRENWDIVKSELESLENEKEKLERRGKVNFLKLWSSKAAIRGLVACVGLTTAQQFCGVNALMFYLVSIFQTTATNIDPYLSSIIVTITQLVFSCLAVFVIEKLNRKTFLYLSTAGTGISLAGIGAYFHLKYHNHNFPFLNLIPLLSIVVFYIFFALGFGPVPWLINSELFSPEIKGLANGITIATNWTLLFIVTKSFPILIEMYQPFYIFYFFALSMVFCMVFIFYCIPETKGKSLQEIQEKLNK